MRLAVDSSLPRSPTLPSPSARRVALLLSFSFAVALPASCGSSGGTGSNPAGNVVIRDANNYTSQSSLSIPVVQTASGQDLTISWSGISKDLLCHPAASIDNVAFLKIGNMSQGQVEAKLANGQLVSSEVTTYREQHTVPGDGGAAATSTLLSKLSYGSPLVPATDYVEAASTQYLLLFTHGTTLGVGAQTMAFLQPSASSPQNLTVAAEDACSNNFLTFSAMLSTMPVSIPVNGPWKIDWSQITKDNFGNPLDFSQTKLDKVEVAFFENMTAADLQTHFLDIEINATSLYSVAVPAGQKYVDLTAADSDAGAAFPGFGLTDGTWAAAVLCSTCSVPAPVVFVILQPQ